MINFLLQVDKLSISSGAAVSNRVIESVYKDRLRFSKYS